MIYFHPTFTDQLEQKRLQESFKVHKDFINENEEKLLDSEVLPILKRLRYEEDHWDAAILGYRETEKKDWNLENSKILQRVRETSFSNGSAMPLVHVLDLKVRLEFLKKEVNSANFKIFRLMG